MSMLHCRVCDEEIVESSDVCPHCETRKPFSCEVCGAAVGMLVLIGTAYPFSQGGKPLCPQHVLHLCDKCRIPYPPDRMHPVILYWKQKNVLHSPVPVKGLICTGCKATHIDPPPPAGRSWRTGIGRLFGKRG